MIDPKYTQQLYDALALLFDAVSRQPPAKGRLLFDAWEAAAGLLNKIDDCTTPVISGVVPNTNRPRTPRQSGIAKRYCEEAKP